MGRVGQLRRRERRGQAHALEGRRGGGREERRFHAERLDVAQELRGLRRLLLDGGGQLGHDDALVEDRIFSAVGPGQAQAATVRERAARGLALRRAEGRERPPGEERLEVRGREGRSGGALSYALLCHAGKWVEDVRSERGNEVVIMLVGNKTDLSDRR